MADNNVIAEVKAEAVGGGVSVSNPPYVQCNVHYVHEHLDEIGAALAAGGIVRIVDNAGNRLTADTMPADVASAIEAARVSHESRRVAAPKADEGDAGPA